MHMQQEEFCSLASYSGFPVNGLCYNLLTKVYTRSDRGKFREVIAMEKTKRLFGFLAILAGVFFVLSESAFAQNWEQTYNELKAKIAKEYSEPVDKGYMDSAPKDLSRYLHWMGIKAADRNRAQGLSAAASNAGNPYWEKKFLDLMEEAHNSGESTLWKAVSIFMRLKSDDSWGTAVHKSDYFGKALYTRAKELNFDAPFVRETVRCLMRFALGDVEQGRMALYCGRSLEHGTQYDDEGTLIMPEIDFDVTCLPRSAFHMSSAGRVCIPTDIGLSWVEQIRDVCEWFQLHEANEATDLMNQFYEDSMCLAPPNVPKQGHRNFYRKLAQEYKLQKSVDYNKSFYGELYGKVEIEAKGNRVPAANAVVTVTIPNDGETRTADTDSEGNYEMEDVLLHKDCSPFKITAEHGQDKIVDSFDGPLEEPDPSYRHEKNLTIRKGDLLCTISWDFNWEDKAYDSNNSLRTREYGSVSVMATGIMRIRLKESSSLSEWYDPENFKISYVYASEFHDLKNKKCPSLKWKLKGSGSVEPRSGPISFLRIMQMGAMGNYLEFTLPGTELQTVKGRRQISTWHPDCKTYENYSREVVFGNLFMRLPVGKSGRISGSRSWSCGAFGGSPFHLSIAHFGNRSEYEPRESEPTKEHTTNINAFWTFEKLKK